MSLETAVAVALAGCAVGGAIGVAGVLVGLLVGRRLEERPLVRCVVSDWDLKLYEESGPLGRVVCSFEIDLFNEGLATGLRGPSVVFYGDDGGWVAAVGLRDAVSKRDLWAIDLPSRKWAHVSVYALLEGGEAHDASRFRQVHLIGGFPDGTAFERKIVERRDFVATRKKKGDDRKYYVASHNLPSWLLGRRKAAG